MAYRTTNPEGAKQLLEEEGWLYVDVRTPEEFDAGHVPGAFNVPVAFRGPAGMEPNPDFVEVVERHFPRDAKLLLGCAMGGRSARACEMLERDGYGQLANVHGGFSGARDESGRVTEPGWAERGYPVTTDADTGRSWDELRS